MSGSIYIASKDVLIFNSLLDTQREHAYLVFDADGSTAGSAAMILY